MPHSGIAGDVTAVLNKRLYLAPAAIEYHPGVSFEPVNPAAPTRISRGTAVLGLIVLLLWGAPAVGEAEPEPEPVRIGVLSHRGYVATLQLWGKTAEYLSEHLPEYRFAIVPLDFNEVEPAVDAWAIDFILVNPGIYVSLEVQHRISRIATLNNRRGTPATPYNLFGGVIFARADREDIQSLHDLVGKSMLAVDETSLGGYQMAWREMAAEGITPGDLGLVRFAGTHDAVVMAVRAGEVDVGTVRTDILERMADRGRIDLSEFRVINPQVNTEFPFAHSTRLYPEWPFSKLFHTSNTLAQRVAVALLNMPQDHPAALVGQYAGWTIPLDYQPVHEAFQELRLPPYEKQVTLGEVTRQYWHWLVGTGLALMLMAFLSTWVIRLNRQIRSAKSCLEQQHKLILDSVADGIYGVDRSGRSTFVNRAMEQMTGWKAEEVIGRNQHDILHHTRADGSYHPPSECPVYATYLHNQPRFVADDVFWRKDGSAIPVEYSSNPVQNERGEVIGAVVVFRDTTERKEAEEDARQRQLELARASRLSTLGEMASGIAHELNQPLSAITNYTRGCIRMLRSGEPSLERIGEAMERVAAQAERAGEIIRQIRRFIRKEEPERRPAELDRVVRELVGFIGPEARRAGTAVHLRLEEGLPAVLAHEIQIEQVILNLIRNALEAMADIEPSRRQLVIEGNRVGDQVQICVEDSGCGVGEALGERIFEPFVTTKTQGMGLGLSISRGIIESHGGDLTAGTGSRGARFCFRIPIHEPKRRSDNAA